MWKKLKRPLAFVLTLAMLVSLTNFEQFSVLAEGAPETTTTAAESKTSEKAEEKNTEKSEKEESASEKTKAEKKESGKSSDKEETKEDSEKKSSESQTEAVPESTTGKKEEGTSAKEKEDASTEKKEDGEKSEEKTEAKEKAFSAEKSTDDITVKADAEKGVLPDGTKMEISYVGTKSDSVENAFKEKEISCDGYLAFKVTFTKDDKEVEPEGKVKMTVTMPESKLSESADTATLKIRRVRKTTSESDGKKEEKTDVDTMATYGSDSDATIFIKDEKVKAEFNAAHDGTFVYTWDEKEEEEKEAELKSQTVEATIYASAEYKEALSNDNTKITLSGNMPENAVVKAYPAVLADDILSDENILAAYDISIFDKDGNKYEPDAENPISVSIVSDMITEEKAKDISVYHMDNEEAEPEAVKVGTVKGDEVTFEAEKFSIYVVTGDGSATDNKVNINIDSYIALEPGQSIEVKANDDSSERETFSWTASPEEVVTLGSWTNGTGGEDSTATITAGSSPGETTVTLTSTYTSWWEHTNTKTIHVYVLPKATDSSSLPTEGKISYNKEAVKTNEKNSSGDSIYDLSLTFTGTKKNFKKKQRVDVLFIVDVSGSMAPNDNGKREDRIQAARDAISTFVDTAGAGNLDLDARYALVKFSGNESDGSYNDASVVHGWQTAPSTGSLSARGGTNYEAGLLTANDLLKNDWTDATKLVIFLTDGTPTYYYNSSGNTAGRGTGYDETAMSHAKKQVTGLHLGENDYFYAVGCGTATDTYMSDLAGAATQCKHGYITKANASDLSKAFEAIAAGNSTVEMKDVTITDTLSDNVEFSAGSAANAIKNSIKVMKGDSDDTANWTISVDGKKVTATRTFAKGAFDTDAKYKLVIPVVPSETAKTYYENNNGSYPDTADLNTGTWAGQSGFKSNSSATVSYKDTNNSGETLKYPDPVVRVSGLKVTKSIKKEDAARLTENLTFDVSGTKNKYKDYGGSTVTISKDDLIKATEDSNGYVSVTKTICVPEDDYTVTEDGTKAEIDGYNRTTSYSGGSGTSNNSVTVADTNISIPKVTCTNTYVKKDCTITLTKKVTGNMGDKDKEFSFTVSTDKGTLAVPDNGNCTLNSTDNTVTAELHDGETATITVPYGATITIKETNGSGYTASYVVGSESKKDGSICEISKITENTNITFTNDKNVAAATAMVTSYLPYLLAVAGAGALFTVLMAEKKRKRGKRDRY